MPARPTSSSTITSTAPASLLFDTDTARSLQMSDNDDDREELQALSLSQLFARALSAASDANDLPTNSDVTQVNLRAISYLLKASES